MTLLDWVVLVATTAFIVGFGIWKTHGASRTAESFLHGGYELKWHTIGLSVMATQASAITFLSTPGQAYEDGMRFVQFYFGLPLAMVVVSAFFVPIFYKLNVVTAYEFLEQRFDLPTRLLAGIIFLIQRGVSTGITVYAPAIILSAILGWPLNPTILAMGGVVIVYTVSGGSRAVSQTQKQQMVVMLGGMVVAAFVIVWRLPQTVSFGGALDVAGAFGRMNAISFSLDLKDRYNVWSGLTGGFFLQLAYFGTDQSQVGRYLAGKSIAESRLGLLFNGILKIPMQFLILFVGVLVFVFYQFTTPPLLFNEPLRQKVHATAHHEELVSLEQDWERVQREKRTEVDRYVLALKDGDSATAAQARAAMKEHGTRADGIRKAAKGVVSSAVPGAETKDSDYIFITFIKDWLPSGFFGLLMAVILAAAMGSIASELNALGSCTTVDFYRRLIRKDATPQHALRASKVFTVLWGLAAVAFAGFASLIDNLIQAVNILGSIFYGTVLGLFVVAFAVKRVGGKAVFLAAVVSQAAVIAVYVFTDLGYLWFNLIGCVLVVVVGLLASLVFPRPGGVTAS
jgi:Na+/proline symporter